MSRSFDGTDGSQRIVCSYVSAVDLLGTSLSIAAWVYPLAIGGERTIIGKPAAVTHISPFWDWFFGINPSGKLQSRFTGSSGNKIATTALTANVWTHVAMTYDGTNVLFYINGALDATVADTGSVTNVLSQGVRIGANRADNEVMNGVIAHAACWSVVLSIGEIISHKSGKTPQRGNLKGWWELNGLGDPEPDWSGNVNNGVVTGATRENHTPACAPFA